MVCNRCGAEIPPGYAWCVRCGTWAQVQQGGWPYAPPRRDPRQMTPGQRYSVPGYYYQTHPAAPGAQCPMGYGYYQQQGWDAVRGGAYVRGGASLVYSLVTLACGLAVILSTFLPWASMLGFNVSGWRMMWNVAGSDIGNFLFAHGEGMIIFTGFWSLLVGVAMAVGIAVLLSGRRSGGRIAQVAGGLGLVLSITTAVMLYTHSVGADIGLWMFIVFSLAAVILTQLAIRSAFFFAERSDPIFASLVEVGGIEPPASGLQSPRSPN
jgi:hypothetical protein